MASKCSSCQVVWMGEVQEGVCKLFPVPGVLSVWFLEAPGSLLGYSLMILFLWSFFSSLLSQESGHHIWVLLPWTHPFFLFLSHIIIYPQHIQEILLFVPYKIVWSSSLHCHAWMHILICCHPFFLQVWRIIHWKLTWDVAWVLSQAWPAYPHRSLVIKD